MATLLRSAPVLLVRDVPASVAHFRDRMGFDRSRLWGEPPDFAIIARDGLHLMLRQADPARIVPHTSVSPGMWDAYFWVDDADALHAEFVRRGATIDYGPCDQPYGCREFGTRDPDGHDLGFGQVLPDAPPS